MKRFSILLLVTIFVLVAIISALEIPKDKESIKLISKKKEPVLFNHLKHSKFQGVTCKNCHHMLDKGTSTYSCRACHGTKDSEVNSMKAFHGCCISCHKKSEKPGAPLKCNECHRNVE